MKCFVIGLYNFEKSSFPIKTKTVFFDTYSEAEDCCKKLNGKLKKGFWKIDVLM